MQCNWSQVRLAETGAKIISSWQRWKEEKSDRDFGLITQMAAAMARPGENVPAKVSGPGAALVQQSLRKRERERLWVNRPAIVTGGEPPERYRDPKLESYQRMRIGRGRGYVRDV